MGVVLASRSPRRVALLTSRGVEVIVDPADIDETINSGEPPGDYVRRMALSKHVAVSTRHPGATVVAADTIVELNGTVHGQPADIHHARHTLFALSGATHRVTTCVMVGEMGRAASVAVTSEVSFRVLSPSRVEWYLATGEWRGKAGSYGIQGLGMVLVGSVQGSLSNVVGLPMPETLALLGRNEADRVPAG